MATGTVDLTPDPATIQVKDLTPDPSTIQVRKKPSLNVKAAQAIAKGSPVVGQEPLLGRVLQAPGREVSAFAARGSLTGAGETPKQNEADLNELVNRIPFLGDLQSANGPGFARFVAGSMFDPTTFAGGSGLLAKIAKGLGLRSSGALAKVSDLIPELHLGSHQIKPIEDIMEHMVFGGKEKMALSRLLNPEQAATVWAHMRAAKSIGRQAEGTLKDQAAVAGHEFTERISPMLKDMMQAANQGKRVTKATKPAVDAVKAKVQRLEDLAEHFFTTDPKGIVGHMEEHKVGAMFFGAMRKLTDIPKQVLVGSSPARHVQNISFLDALHYPQTLPKAVWDMLRSTGNPELKASILKHATEQGLTSGKGAESGAFLQFLEKAPLLARMGGGGALGAYSAHQQGQNPLVGAAMGAGAGAIAPAWYKKSTGILWLFDHMVKNSALNSVAHGYMKHMSEADAWARAAKDVGDRLVNYDELSPFVKDLRNFMPFASWAVKSAGSIFRALSEHPERALAILRAWPAAGGDLQKTGDIRIIKTKPGISKKTGRVTPAHLTREPLGASMSTPLAEVARRLQDPAAAVRSQMGPAWQGLAGAAEMLFTKNQHPYSTYGQNPFAWTVQQELQAPGMPSAFGDSPLDALIFGQTGIGQRALPKP